MQVTILKQVSTRAIMHGMALLLTLTTVGQTAQAQTQAPATNDEKLSYAIAVEISRRFAQQGWAIDEEMAVRGFRDSAQGKLALPEDEMRRVLNGLQGQARQRASMDRRIASLMNLRKGEAAMAVNAAAPGVVSLPSGVQYRVLSAGKGTAMGTNDTVRVSYVVRLLDGKEVMRVDRATSVEREALIPGLRELVDLMPADARWRAWIPPEQAYGVTGQGETIGPNQTLVLDLERHPAAQTRQDAQARRN